MRPELKWQRNKRVVVDVAVADCAAVFIVQRKIKITATLSGQRGLRTCYLHYPFMCKLKLWYLTNAYLSILAVATVGFPQLVLIVTPSSGSNVHSPRAAYRGLERTPSRGGDGMNFASS